MKMKPASSSSDDSSSVYSSSSDEDLLPPKNNGGDRVDGLEPVGSSDDNSDDEDSEEEYGERSNISNFDDLPTDDSEDESDNDSDDGSVENKRVLGNGYMEGSSEDEDKDGDYDARDGDGDDLPLGERVACQAREGRRYTTGDDATTGRHDSIPSRDGGKKRRAERKSQALELASQRLREARQENGAKKEPTSEDSSDDNSVEQSSSKNNQHNSREEPRRKKSKHAPTEMSSKRRDYFARGRPDLNSSGIGVSIGANKYKARDPRMISLSGHLDADVFEHRYGFLDEVQEKEIEQLKRRVAAWKKAGKKGQKERRKLGMTQEAEGSLDTDQEELTRLLQERAERNKAKVVRGAKQSVKQKLREDVAAGKRGAYYPKRNELKRMEAEAKYEEIRKRGGGEAVDKAIEKRRKKNLSKAAKQMPSHKV